MTDDEARDDVDFEPEEELGDIGAAQAKLKKLRTELKEAQQKASENLAGWQREKADSINARKDALREAQRAVEREKESFVYDLLPVLDSFDMAFAGGAFEAMSSEWQQGMKHIQNQLLGVLESHGIQRYGKLGEKFEPALHEAMQETDELPGDPHTIVRILRHGYRMGERIIRPAQVIVRA
jgi:molecular chaperone GrpE